MFRRFKNWLTSGLRPPGPRFVIHEGYQIDIPFPEYDSRRPFRILGYLRKRHLLRRGMLLTPRSVSLSRLQRVHDPAYIRSLEKAGALEPVLGMSVDMETQDRFLSFQRMMCGGTLKCAHNALKRKQVAVNLGGGLHHASRDRGSGFCVFNDVAVAIAFLRDEGHEIPVLVIDLDLHDGDGTREIFADDPTVYTFSIHNRDLGGTAAVASTSIALGTDVGDETYLAAIRDSLPQVFDSFQPGLVIYLAGSDPSVDDRLGDWRISSEGLLERDRLVTDLVRPPGSADQVPMVVLLAGGYGPMAWRHAAAYFSWLLRGSTRLDIPLELELPVDHYRKLARLMKHRQRAADDDPGTGPPGRRGPALDADEDWGLTEQDLGAAIMMPDTLFLGVYSRHGMELALEESGLLDRLRSRGFRALRVSFDLDDPMGHTLRIRAGETDPQVVVETKLRTNRQMQPGRTLLAVEWLLVQDVNTSFELSHPLLPGQEFPGLGLMRDIAAVLVVACERMDLDGLVFIPTHFHLAALAHPMAVFADPVQQARLMALRRAVRGLRLEEAAKAVADGQVIDAHTRESVGWIPSPMVIPVAADMKRYFGSAEYESQVAKARKRFRFRLTPG